MPGLTKLGKGSGTKNEKTDIKKERNESSIMNHFFLLIFDK